ncbi:MAG: hypothetical protein D6731_18735, partial [Planctomycetota bacterium]
YTGQAREVSLKRLGLTTAEARRDWLIRKSRDLAQSKAARAAGEMAPTETTVTEAVADYLAAAGHRLRPATVLTYREGLDLFAVWAAKTRLPCIEDLDLPRLAAFREWLIARPRQRVVKGARRGERAPGVGTISPASINSRLRSVKAALNHWRRLGLTPRLDRDKIADGLARVPEPRPRPDFLRPSELRELLGAALRHDADTFDETREEHAGRKPKGSTLRHEPVGPFVLVTLLTGCRVGEVLALRWASVDFDEQEIVLAATATKTKHERSVSLEVAPALVDLLRALKLRSEGPYVFGGKRPWSRSRVEAARKRLSRDYGSPSFTWQRLRQTCATFLVNAPAIYGAASAYRAARQLGHSVAVAERNYLGLAKSVPKDATTLEAAMRIESEVDELLAAAGASPKRQKEVRRA